MLALDFLYSLVKAVANRMMTLGNRVCEQKYDDEEEGGDRAHKHLSISHGMFLFCERLYWGSAVRFERFSLLSVTEGG